MVMPFAGGFGIGPKEVVPEASRGGGGNLQQRSLLPATACARGHQRGAA
jgi:hypothetical protein